ncbi:hypothetical protein A2U01_0035630 [Trifolium medium]|uniref:Uncharacterized protein n=1 Tax=Trifolium medium TaxID=97028 RepID=A0A392PSM3_9FABA|nr:hypothetical protein [Trifolium medium]
MLPSWLWWGARPSRRLHHLTQVGVFSLTPPSRLYKPLTLLLMLCLVSICVFASYGSDSFSSSTAEASPQWWLCFVWIGGQICIWWFILVSDGSYLAMVAVVHHHCLLRYGCC